MAPPSATASPHLNAASPGTGRARRDEDGTDAQDGGADGSAPRLDLDGFSGPLDLLLDLARSRRIDLHRIALPDLVAQLAPALRQAASLAERGGWLVMTASIVLLRSRLLLRDLPAANPKGRGLRTHPGARNDGTGDGQLLPGPPRMSPGRLRSAALIWDCPYPPGECRLGVSRLPT